MPSTDRKLELQAKDIDVSTISQPAVCSNGLKNNSSAGFDEIPTFLVKQCLCHFIKPLVHIYNVSFQTGTFPDMMKIAKVKPLYKKRTGRTYKTIDLYQYCQCFLNF